MAVDYTASALKAYPTAAVGASVIPPSTSGGTGAWAEMIAATPVAWLLAGIEVLPEQVASIFYGDRFIIDIGVGAVSAETVIASFPGTMVSTGGSSSQTQYVLPILIDAIASGARVSARIRRWDETTPTGAWKVKVLYYEKPISGDVVTTANALKIYPAGRPTVVLTATGVWVNGAYVELVSSTAAGVILLGALICDSGNSDASDIDIAIGGSGSETVIATLHYIQSTQPSCPGFIPFSTPLDLIPSGSRISARNRADGGTVSVSLGLLYVEKPL